MIEGMNMCMCDWKSCGVVYATLAKMNKVEKRSRNNKQNMIHLEKAL